MTSSFQSTAFQSSARPVDTFVAPPSVQPKTDLEELAEALQSINPAIQTFIGSRIKKEIEKEEAEGTEQAIEDAASNFKKVFSDTTKKKNFSISKVDSADFEIQDGSILIAAITSCTNTSNPNVLIGAGLVAKKAVDLGLKVKPWVRPHWRQGLKLLQITLIKPTYQNTLIN